MTAAQPDPTQVRSKSRYWSNEGPVFTRNQAVHAARIKARLDREADREVEAWVIDLALTPAELLHLEAIGHLEERSGFPTASAVDTYVASRCATLNALRSTWHDTSTVIDVLRDLDLVKVHVGMARPLRRGSEARTAKSARLSLTRAGRQALERANRTSSLDAAPEVPVAAADLRAGDRYDGLTVVVRVIPADPRVDERSMGRNGLIDRVTVEGLRPAGNGRSVEDTRELDADHTVLAVRYTPPDER